MRTFFVACSGALLCAALLACPVSAHAIDPSSPVVVSAGEKFSLNLKSNPTTGYQWQLARPLNENVVRFVDKTFTPSAEATPSGPKIVGAGGVEVWTFEATGKGTAEVPLVYVRPWEKDGKAEGSARFRVEVR